MQQINPTQMLNQIAESVDREPQQQQRVSGITKKVESLFDHLADIFGGKFNLALPDEDSEYGAKNAYSDVINEQDGQTLAYGLKQLVRKRTEGEFKYLDMAEVIQFIMNPDADLDSVQRAWLEYNNRGVKNYKDVTMNNGQKFKEEIGLKWSTDAIAESSKRCGLPQFLIGGEKEFKRVYLGVMREIKNGAEFKQAIAIDSAENMDGRTKEEKEAARKSAAVSALSGLKGLMK